MIIEREVFKRLSGQQKNHAVSILIGARQVGKSTLLHEIRKKTDASCRYINLENPLHLKIFENGYNSFIQEVKEDVIFIDEFHYYKNITSLFKAVFDLNPEKKIYASVSSSLEMHRHLKESLAGRKIQTNIYPFSFSEWLSQYGVSLPEFSEYLRLEAKESLDRYFFDYLIYGAMPGLVDLSNTVEKREYLFNLYQTYISKDIKAFLKEESVLSFNKIIEYLVINNTQQLNINTLSRISMLSSRQVMWQLDVMAGTYVIYLLKPFYTNKGKEITKAPKVYFYDQGVGNTIINDFRPAVQRADKGALIENFVFWEILKSIDIRFNLRYWRTADKKEVDFVLEKDREYFPIEVKSDWDTQRVPTGLKAFFRYYPEVKSGVVLTDCRDSQITYGDKTILFLPWYKASRIKAVLE